MLSDDRDGSLTSLTDNAYIAQTLSAKHFDLLCFDACNMAHLEALYDYRKLADWISASEALMPSTTAGFQQDDGFGNQNNFLLVGISHETSM